MATGSTSQGSPPPSDDPREIRVLLVEDNLGDQRLTREILLAAQRRERFLVEAVPTLAEALTRLGSEVRRYDVVLLDLVLPDSTGADSLTALLSISPDVPVIFLSGHQDEDLAIELVKRGAQDYLTKDFDSLSSDLIRKAIRYAIERAQTYQQLRAMQLRLIQVEKLESIGALAAGVAHEVKNPLARLQLGIDYLREGIDPKDPNLPPLLERMQEAIQTADRIVHGLMDLSTEGEFTLKPADIRQPIAEALLLIEHDLSQRRIELRKDLPEDLPPALIDLRMMEQAFLTLFVNAVQAMVRQAQPVLSIRARVETWDDEEPTGQNLRPRRLRPGQPALVIQVDDNGQGIAPRHLSKVFEPLFTTKAPGVGTGLGLAVAKKILDLHGGDIALENRPEGGVRVRLALPLE